MTPLPDSSKVLAAQQPPVILAMLVWGEARGESWAGKLAVANVPMNRLASNRFGSSVSRIALSPNQFACFNANDPNRPKLCNPLQYDSQETWNDCYRAAILALLGSTDDPSLGAVFYHSDELLGPPLDWGNVVETAAIGRHTFYKFA